MLRGIGKTCFACAYTWSGAHQMLSKRKANDGFQQPFVVCYHRVVDSFERAVRNSIPSLLISTAMLERHIDWIAKRFCIVSLDDLGLNLEFGHRFPKPAAAITFDDGYADLYHHAYPLLKRKGIPAAIFVVTGLVGTGRPQPCDHLYLLLRSIHARRIPLARTVADVLRTDGLQVAALDKLTPKQDEPFSVMTILLNSLPKESVQNLIDVFERRIPVDKEILQEMAPLTWEMIEKMNRDGITIGSHTASHSLLTSENVETAFREVSESKEMLEAKLKTPIKHFAYPDGRFNAAVVEVVKSAGYRYGYGICRSRDRKLPLMTIGRKVLWERSCINAFGRFSPAVMNCHVHGAFSRTDWCSHKHSAA